MSGNDNPLPSSFDDDLFKPTVRSTLLSQSQALQANTAPLLPPENSDFYEESRMQKILRRIKEEPLIPLGCALTCLALFRASRSIRRGDHHETNRMFRYRIYGQAFTLVAMVAGARYYAEDRERRKAVEGAVAERAAAEKRERWIRELEARDAEDREARARQERIRRERMGGDGGIRSALEECELRRRGVLEAVVELREWRR